MTSNSSSPDGVPPFQGYVETTVHALRLIHAARQGVIPRITRRLNDTERRTMIKSGAVFVFSVEESGIKRWTDGMLWSPSRIVGNFLVYREINERASSRGNHKKSYTSEDTSRSLSLHRNASGQISPTYKASSPSSSDQGTFKPNGLIKKTITVTIEGSDLHLISYYTSEDIRAGRLKKPTSRPDIMSLYMPPQLFRLTNFRVPPKVEIGPDGKPRLVAEAEDVEVKVEEGGYSPPSGSPTSLSGGSPVETSYGGSNLYPPLNQPMNYMRSGGGDRWPDNMRVSSPVRPSTAMSMSSPTVPYSGLGSRRELTQGDSWSATLHSPARWSTDSYESSGNSSSFYNPDRSRIRSTPYQSPIQRDTDAGRYSSSVIRNREVASHRSPWLVNQDSGEKESRPHSRLAYNPSGMHYPIDGYHYSGGWASGDSSSSGMASPQSSFTHSSLAPFDNSYAESGKLPAVDNFVTPEDFADS